MANVKKPHVHRIRLGTPDGSPTVRGRCVKRGCSFRREYSSSGYKEDIGYNGKPKKTRRRKK